MRVSLRCSAVLSGLILLAACGGGSATSVPTVKTCAEDPTQAKCIIIEPPVDSGLRF